MACACWATSSQSKELPAFFPTEQGVMPFPGWEPFEGADSADMSKELKERIAANVHPVPEGVAQGVVSYRDERRHQIPTFVICPEFSPAQADEWIESGDVPELAAAEHLELLDLDSGHWPMFTCPDRLADLLCEQLDEAAATEH